MHCINHRAHIPGLYTGDFVRRQLANSIVDVVVMVVIVIEIFVVETCVIDDVATEYDGGCKLL